MLIELRGLPEYVGLTSFDYRNIEYDIVLFCGSFLLLLCGPGQALLGSEWIQARPGWEETQTGTGECFQRSDRNKN